MFRCVSRKGSSWVRSTYVHHPSSSLVQSNFSPTNPAFLVGVSFGGIVGTKVCAGCFLQRACGIKLETRKKGVVCLSVVEGGVRANLYFLDDLMFGVVGSPDSKGWNFQTPGRCALVG